LKDSLKRSICQAKQGLHREHDKQRIQHLAMAPHAALPAALLPSLPLLHLEHFLSRNLQQNIIITNWQGEGSQGSFSPDKKLQLAMLIPPHRKSANKGNRENCFLC